MHLRCSAELWFGSVCRTAFQVPNANAEGLEEATSQLPVSVGKYPAKDKSRCEALRYEHFLHGKELELGPGPLLIGRKL